MPIEVVVVLDSGTLSCLKDTPDHCDIGYFQCLSNWPDINVFVDRKGQDTSVPNKLGAGARLIEVVHKDASGSMKRNDIQHAPNFGSSLLKLSDLYGHDVQVDWKSMDFILRFYSGYFVPSMVKQRDFKKYQSDAKNGMSFTGEKVSLDPIAHNIVVYFNLDDGETFELIADNTTILSSSSLAVSQKLVIEVLADNSTADKFYCSCLMGGLTEYWMPNQGDPPPNCPTRPCPGD